MANLANSKANYLRLDFTTDEKSLSYESFSKGGVTTMERPATEEKLCICVKSAARFRMKLYFESRYIGKLILDAGAHEVALDEQVPAGPGLLVITVDPYTADAPPQSVAYNLVASYGAAYSEHMTALWADRQSA